MTGTKILIDELLEDGWEPFQVVPDERDYVYFRRLKPCLICNKEKEV